MKDLSVNMESVKGQGSKALFFLQGGKRMSTKIGGQAVLEGVMMRDQLNMIIAVRRPDESIWLHKDDISSLSNKLPILKLPVLRGILTFFESLILGVKALNFSADQALEDEDEKFEGWQIGVTLVLALVFGIALFVLLPTFLVRHIVAGGVYPPLLMNLFEGILRLAIFLGYVAAISRMKDIQRVFQYHGAEHKVIHCYEAGLPLTVENARKFSTLHPRCGTSFLLLVMIISIIFFSFFGWPNIWARVTIRLTLLPLIAGISYEAIRFMGRSSSFITRIISYPGIALQYFTTLEPDDSQLEVALRALEPLIRK